MWGEGSELCEKRGHEKAGVSWGRGRKSTGSNIYENEALSMQDMYTEEKKRKG